MSPPCSEVDADVANRIKGFTFSTHSAMVFTPTARVRPSWKHPDRDTTECITKHVTHEAAVDFGSLSPASADTRTTMRRRRSRRGRSARQAAPSPVKAVARARLVTAAVSVISKQICGIEGGVLMSASTIA